MELAAARGLVNQSKAVPSGAANLASAQGLAGQANTQATTAVAQSANVKTPGAVNAWEAAINAQKAQAATLESAKGIPTAAAMTTAVTAVKGATDAKRNGEFGGKINKNLSGKSLDKLKDAAAQAHNAAGAGNTAAAQAAGVGGNNAAAAASAADAAAKAATADAANSALDAAMQTAKDAKDASPFVQAPFDAAMDDLNAKYAAAKTAADDARAATQAVANDTKALANSVYDSAANAAAAKAAIKANEAAQELAKKAEDACKELAQKAADAAALVSQFDDVNAALARQIADARAAETAAAAAAKALADGLADRIAAANDAAASIEEQLRAAEQRLASANTDIQNAKNAQDRANIAVKIAQTLVGAVSVGIGICGRYIKALVTLSPVEAPTPSMLEKALQVVQAARDAMQRQLAAARAALDDLRRQLDEARQAAVAQAAKLAAEVAAAQKELDDAAPVLAQAAKAAADLAKESKECSDAVKDAKKDAADAAAAEQAAITNRMAQLAKEGHGPQRHEGGVTPPQIDERAAYHIDPQTGTQRDLDNAKHECASTASKFETEKAYVLAEAETRANMTKPATKPEKVQIPLGTIFGAGNGAAQVSGAKDTRADAAVPKNAADGFRAVPADKAADIAALKVAGDLVPAVFTDADKASADYLPDGLGGKRLSTMYPN